MKPTPPPPTHNEPRGYGPNVWRPTFPSALVDFNPDLPPAAFPTIDCQQPPKPLAQEVLGSSSNKIGPMQGHGGANIVSGESIVDGHHMAKSNHERGMGRDGDGDVSMLDAGYDFRDNAPDKLDYQACWDYVNYLNELENSAEGVTRSMNLSDDENDVGIGAYEAAGISAVSLSSLPLYFQKERFKGCVPTNEKLLLIEPPSRRKMERYIPNPPNRNLRESPFCL